MIREARTPTELAKVTAAEDMKRQQEETLERAGLDPEALKAAHEELSQSQNSAVLLIVEATRKLLEHAMHLEASTGLDGLTGLPNRARFDQALSGVAMRGARSSDNPELQPRPRSLITLDIDHFKGVNDTYGHRAGDMVLQELAKRLSLTIRPDDFVARVGGEEFSILVQGDETAACGLAERLRRTIKLMRFAIIDNDGVSHTLAITISIGVAACDFNLPDPAETVKVDADRALYAAKKYGRDVVFKFGENGVEKFVRVEKAN